MPKNLIIIIAPFIVVLIGYIIRLERKIAVMATDITWIKQNITTCQPPLEKNSP